MEHKLVIPEQKEVCLPPSKKLESQLNIALVKSICSNIKLTAHVHGLEQEEWRNYFKINTRVSCLIQLMSICSSPWYDLNVSTGACLSYFKENAIGI